MKGLVWLAIGLLSVSAVGCGGELLIGERTAAVVNPGLVALLEFRAGTGKTTEPVIVGNPTPAQLGVIAIGEVAAPDP